LSASLSAITSSLSAAMDSVSISVGGTNDTSIVAWMQRGEAATPANNSENGERHKFMTE
jgi:hypothetical protein